MSAPATAPTATSIAPDTLRTESAPPVEGDGEGAASEAPPVLAPPVLSAGVVLAPPTLAPTGAGADSVEGVVEAKLFELGTKEGSEEGVEMGVKEVDGTTPPSTVADAVVFSAPMWNGSLTAKTVLMSLMATSWMV